MPENTSLSNTGGYFENITVNNNISRDLQDKFYDEAQQIIANNIQNFELDFDFTTLKLLESDEGDQVLYVDSSDFDQSNSSNYGLSISVDGSNLFNPMITTTFKSGTGNYEINYYDENLEKMSMVSINENSETVDVIQPNYHHSGGCAQDVIDCIDDIYTNRGWVSIATFVGTAFVPQVAVAAAVTCIAHNC